MRALRHGPLQLELAQAPKKTQSKESKVLSAEELGHIFQEPFERFNFNDFIATFAIYRECARIHKEQTESTAEATKPVEEMFLCWKEVLAVFEENPCVPMYKFEAIPVDGILLRHQSQTSYTSICDIASIMLCFAWTSKWTSCELQAFEIRQEWQEGRETRRAHKIRWLILPWLMFTFFVLYSGTFRA